MSDELSIIDVDLNYFRTSAYHKKQHPTYAQQERFLELVAKKSECMSDVEARSEAYREVMNE